MQEQSNPTSGGSPAKIRVTAHGLDEQGLPRRAGFDSPCATNPPFYKLNEAEKYALLAQQADMIDRLVAGVGELEALVGRRRKTSKSLSVPPSKVGFSRAKPGPKRPGHKRASRPVTSRPLTLAPGKTERRMADTCAGCGAEVTRATQRRRRHDDHIDLPVIRPVVTSVELFGERCRCGKRFYAPAPADITPATPFGPGLRSWPMYLDHSHHIHFKRLSRLASELCALSIAESAVTSIFRRTGEHLASAVRAITAKLVQAKVIASPETTTRTNGVIHWQWVYISNQAVLHTIAARRSRSVAKGALGCHQPHI